MPRLFTGLEIPADVKRALSFLRGGLPGARWVEPENYHITLRFMGDVDRATANEITALLMRARKRSFKIRFEGLSSFGGRKPRAVVAAIAPEPTLMELQTEQERLMRRIGLEPETRNYAPHVTLAWLRASSSEDVAHYLSERALIHAPAFHVDRFVLYSSRDSVGGGPYIVEQAFPFEDEHMQGAVAVRG